MGEKTLSLEEIREAIECLHASKQQETVDEKTVYALSISCDAGKFSAEFKDGFPLNQARAAFAAFVDAMNSIRVGQPSLHVSEQQEQTPGARS
jgi:hypothetical protein